MKIKDVINSVVFTLMLIAICYGAYRMTDKNNWNAGQAKHNIVLANEDEEDDAKSEDDDDREDDDDHGDGKE